MSTIKHLASKFLEAQGFKSRTPSAPTGEAPASRVDRLNRREPAAERRPLPRAAEVVVHPEVDHKMPSVPTADGDFADRPLTSKLML